MPKRPENASKPVGLRIIGGQFRGQRLEYGGDPRVRPMKDRVREAVFNLLADTVRGKHVLDLFAGTGALGLEAISRGALRATLIEQHYPTADVLRRNIAALDAQQRCEVITGNVFLRARWQKTMTTSPWLVFSSPPYVFYVERQKEMLDLIGGLMESAPAESVVVVEADRSFDMSLLPEPANWDIREYPPAVIAIDYR